MSRERREREGSNLIEHLKNKTKKFGKLKIYFASSCDGEMPFMELGFRVCLVLICFDLSMLAFSNYGFLYYFNANNFRG